jgi:hypothetical protein
MARRRTRSALLALAWLPAVLLPACAPGRPPLQPVRGQVFFAGQPAAGALVVFHPVDDPALDAPRPSALVGPDGSFRLGTFAPNDGAPVGDYRVAIAWPAGKASADPRTGEVANRLPARYADPLASNLRVQVREGPNDLPPFQLAK